MFYKINESTEFSLFFFIIVLHLDLHLNLNVPFYEVREKQKYNTKDHVYEEKNTKTKSNRIKNSTKRLLVSFQPLLVVAVDVVVVLGVEFYPPVSISSSSSYDSSI